MAKQQNNTNMNKTAAMGRLLEFDVAFPGEQPLTLDEYLKGGSRSAILKVATFFLGFKPTNSRFKDNNVLLGAIFSEPNKNFSNNVYKKILEVEQSGTTVGIINPICSLRLFEYFFVLTEEEETQSHEEFEINLFKAYLVLNSNYTKAQSAAFKTTRELDPDLRPSMAIFCMQYPVSDKINYDIREIWTTQVIKAIHLFQYLESQPQLSKLFSAFLAHFNSPTWQEYLKNIIPLTTAAIQNPKEGFLDMTVEHNSKFDESCAFIEKLMVQESDPLDEHDFLTIRAKPFYKVGDGVYRIIYNLFAVEKIFKGVYFFLRDINKNLPEEDKITELKSVYGDEFSEKILTYKVIDNIYPQKAVKFTGKQFSDLKINGAPDYYLRANKNILLFESKDFLIRADKKTSFDFNVYESEFQRVLYYEILAKGKEKHKAVMQLINNVRKVLTTDFSLDKDYKYRDVYIYPILLTHDHQYDTAGFNDLLNYWFKDELVGLEEDGLYINHVKPLTVVNIDTLIYHQVGLKETVPLHAMIELYQNFVHEKPTRKFKDEEEYKQFVQSKMIPFSLYLERYFAANKIGKYLPLMDIVGPVLFKDEWEKRNQTQNV
jgi:hypothetical protein